MFKFKLPIWVVQERHRKAPLPNTPCEEADAAPAFTTPDRAIEFLKASEAGRWKIEFASHRDDLMMIVADLHRDGLKGICVDAQPDGNGGDLATLPELMAFCNTLSG